LRASLPGTSTPRRMTHVMAMRVQCWPCCHWQYSMPGTSRAPRAAHAPFPRRACQELAHKSAAALCAHSYIFGGWFSRCPACIFTHTHALAPRLPVAMGRRVFGEQQHGGFFEDTPNRLPAHPYPSASQGACKVHNEFSCMRAGAHACAASDNDKLRWASPAAQACAPAAPSTF